MEFVITRSPPEPATATGLGRKFVLNSTQIRDDHGTVLGQIYVSTQPNEDHLPIAVTRVLNQSGVVTAEFTRGVGTRPELWFTYDNLTMRVQPRNYYVCEEIHARTVLPWYPPGQCVYIVDDRVDPVSALFLFQMLEALDDERP